jgi:hypothetical protein
MGSTTGHKENSPNRAKQQRECMEVGRYYQWAVVLENYPETHKRLTEPIWHLKMLFQNLTKSRGVLSVADSTDQLSSLQVGEGGNGQQLRFPAVLQAGMDGTSGIQFGEKFVDENCNILSLETLTEVKSILLEI